MCVFKQDNTFIPYVILYSFKGRQKEVVLEIAVGYLVQYVLQTEAGETETMAGT